MDEGNTPDADGQFENCPCANFNDGQVNFDTNRFDNANNNYGSVSGFFPKSLLDKGKGHPFGCPLACRIGARNSGGGR